MRSSASRELLAPRAEVWAFLAEPYHLADWWPGVSRVEPDLRGFAPGARWKVRVQMGNIFVGRRERETLLLVREIELYERWAWHLLKPELDVEVSLRAAGPDRTEVACSTSGRRRVAVQAVHEPPGLRGSRPDVLRTPSVGLPSMAFGMGDSGGLLRSNSVSLITGGCA